MMRSSGTIPSPTELEAMRQGNRRERDRLWCLALIATLSVDDIQKVTAEFLRLREKEAQ